MRRAFARSLSALLLPPVLALASILAPTLAPAIAQAQEPTAPATAPAVGQPSDAPPGSELEVYVMTMGQGDLLWERFGHNALGIRDTRTGTDVVFNWGMFSFEQPGFLPRFLRGEMRYWMAGFDATQMLLAYQRDNRSVSVQRLNLTAAQKDSLRRFVFWNSQDEHKFYRYDYYRDNCSTRVRDAIDRVIGGAIRRASDTVVTSMTYRDHSLRLMDGMFWTRTGIDLALGHPTDRRISSWEAMFIPMEFQRRLRDIRVPDVNGQLVPLVVSEQELFTATRPPELTTVPSLALGGFALGVIVAILCYLAGFRVAGARWAATLAFVWGAVAGILGLLLLLLWVATQHVAAHANQNLFFINPLWLAVATLLPFVGSSRRWRDALLHVVRVLALLSVVGAIVALTPWGQPSGAIAAYAAPVNVAMYFLVLRVVYLAQQRVNRDAAHLARLSHSAPRR
ncbi:MAG: DUF4105 domain-containing protein [Gemmatimonadaceae bacterium]|nr:DUF4105 domain-containing protein [Gemmatimonadaceae bacterium]